MLKRQFSRRGFLTLAGATGGGAVLAACVPVEAPVDQQAASDSGEAMPDVEMSQMRPRACEYWQSGRHAYDFGEQPV